MAYVPPNTFTAGTVCNSTQVQGNFDALKVYLHGGVAVGDLQSSPAWVEAQHVQSPRYNAYTGLQHGATGHQGGQSSGGPLVRATFTSSFLSGAKSGSRDWITLPQAALRIRVMEPGTMVFHYSWEMVAGPDTTFGSSTTLPAIADRVAFIAPYLSNYSVIQGQTDLPAITQQGQETNNNASGFFVANKSPTSPYEMIGYGARCGTHTADVGVGDFVIGLCSFSEVDRVAIINWSVAIEMYYL